MFGDMSGPYPKIFSPVDLGLPYPSLMASSVTVRKKKKIEKEEEKGEGRRKKRKKEKEEKKRKKKGEGETLLKCGPITAANNAPSAAARGARYTCLKI